MVVVEMKAIVVALIFCLFMPVSYAQYGMYKCVSQGLTIYQEQPCKTGARSTTLGAEGSPRPAEDDVVADIKRRVAKRDEEERIAAEYRERANIQRRLEARCTLLLRTAARSKEAADMWDDRSLVAEARIRKRVAEEAFVKECYGVLH